MDSGETRHCMIGIGFLSINTIYMCNTEVAFLYSWHPIALIRPLSFTRVYVVLESLPLMPCL